MTLQRIIEELENILDQATDDDEIEKEGILEALKDVVRDAKGVDSLDFEVDDAIKKLEKLNLMSRDKNGILTVLSMDEALSQMDYIWDNYFDFNKPENS